MYKYKFCLEAEYTVETIFIFPLVFFLTLFFFYLNFYLHDRVCLTAEAYELAENSMENADVETIGSSLWMSKIEAARTEKKAAYKQIVLTASFQFPVSATGLPTDNSEEQSLIEVQVRRSSLSQAEKARIITVLLLFGNGKKG